MKDFYERHSDLCIYETGPSGENFLEIVEFAPKIFGDIRRKFNVSETMLFNSFAPIHNITAIHNFFTGSGKSQSFFFFSDNKAFVLKTMRESEKKLLFE